MLKVFNCQLKIGEVFTEKGRKYKVISVTQDIDYSDLFRHVCEDITDEQEYKEFVEKSSALREEKEIIEKKLRTEKYKDHFEEIGNLFIEKGTKYISSDIMMWGYDKFYYGNDSIAATYGIILVRAKDKICYQLHKGNKRLLYSLPYSEELENMIKTAQSKTSDDTRDYNRLMNRLVEINGLLNTYGYEKRSWLNVKIYTITE